MSVLTLSPHQNTRWYDVESKKNSIRNLWQSFGFSRPLKNYHLNWKREKKIDLFRKPSRPSVPFVGKLTCTVIILYVFLLKTRRWLQWSAAWAKEKMCVYEELSMHTSTLSHTHWYSLLLLALWMHLSAGLAWSAAYTIESATEWKKCSLFLFACKHAVLIVVCMRNAYDFVLSVCMWMYFRLFGPACPKKLQQTFK